MEYLFILEKLVAYEMQGDDHIIPFIESKVLMVKNDQHDYDKIAQQIGLDGYAILESDYSRKYPFEQKMPTRLKHYIRYEITEKNINTIKDLLPKIRRNVDLISVNTSIAKVAQWVIKDNRVDIISIPLKNLKEIITEPFANVAAQNNTFLEIDLSYLLDGSLCNMSINIRLLTRIMNVLLKEDAPFVFTLNVGKPLDFRDKRGIISLGKMLGVPRDKIITNFLKFYERCEVNRKKLSEEFVAPGIWKVLEKTEKKIRENQRDRESPDSLSLEIPQILKEFRVDTFTFERQRYLLFEILKETDQILSDRDFLDCFWALFTKLFGEVGSSRAGIYLSYFDLDKSMGILRCNSYSLDSVKATLTSMTLINNFSVLIHVMKVSGTIKNLNKIAKKR